MKMYQSLSYQLKTWLNRPLPILVNSIPKSGTNLLKNIILSIPHTKLISDLSLASEIIDETERLVYIQERIQRPHKGNVYTGHIPYADSISKWLVQKRIKQVIIYRDPRAVAVSGYHYLKRFKDANNARGRMYFELFNQFEDDSQRLLAYIQGIGRGKTEYYYDANSVPNIRLIFDAYLSWIEQPETLAVRYEDFIGSEGVNMESATKTVQKIIDFIDTADSLNAEALFVKGQNPEISATYRKGLSEAWRKEFTTLHYDAFNTVAGDLLVKLGYKS